MQLSVQRRLSRGLQMGLAYTLSKSEGMQGWDFMTEELGGKQGLRDRYYGPPAGNPTGVQDGRQDRRHVVVINYSYMIPNPMPNVPVLKHVLRDWEASGVSTFMTGSNVNPTCGTNLSGVDNTDPTLSGVGVRCELVPGQDVNDIPAGPGDPTSRTTRSGRTSTWPRSVGRCRSTARATSATRRRVCCVTRAGRTGTSRWRVAFRSTSAGAAASACRRSSTTCSTWCSSSAWRPGTPSRADGQHQHDDTGQYDEAINPFNFGITVRMDY